MRPMTGKRAGTLLELMSQIEHFTLGRAWRYLSDDEFFWEPFTTTWSIRRQDQCRTPNPFGAGEWVADFRSLSRPPSRDHHRLAVLAHRIDARSSV